MGVFGIAAVLLFMVASVVVGTRLLALWRRTRQKPELLLGTALWCTGFLGFALGVVAQKLLSLPEGARLVLQVLDLSGEYAGAAALMLFAWQVFRRDEPWAAKLAAAWGLLCILALAGELGTGQYQRYTDSIPVQGPFVPFGLAVRTLAPAWMTVEAVRYHGMLRKRRRLGLASPLVVNRLGLWALASGASALGYAVSVAHRLAYGTGLDAHVWVVNGVGVLAFVSAVSIALAFFPPRAYRRWVLQR